MLIDTTVQEKNITFPTDAKLHVIVVGRLWKIARQEKIQLRRTYARELKEIIRTINFNKSPKKNKIVSKSRRRLGVIANALLREVKRKVSAEILVVGKKYGVILAAKNFSENLYDGDTLPATFEQMEHVLNYLPILGIADRGYRGRKLVANVKRKSG